ncbi:uncharacterized protein LOC108681753 [Hyalella azteca]|uniref:Uncharacterized protein LOC108681753 n=1 Tax=Hyalella azteca TaxID=294128 RepID=A0A8B7PJZ0_HYAAZ|nr:uncharacterized protein LOC108681753 [Hyalella azteca]
MDIKALVTLLVLMLLLQSGPGRPQVLPGDMARHHLADLGIDNKALFTLGALAVLGGASFYLGRHVGMNKAAPNSYYNYGTYGYPTSLYGQHGYQNTHAQYGYYQPYKAGFTAGVYAAPLAYGGRRKRRASTDKETKENSLNTKEFAAPQSVSSSCREKDTINQGKKLKNTHKTEDSNSKMIEVLENEVNESPEKSNPTKSRGPRIKRESSKAAIVVTSQPINVADDPHEANKIIHLSSGLPSRQKKPLLKVWPEPRSPTPESESLYSRLKHARVSAAVEKASVPESRQEDSPKFKTRFPEGRQQVLCEDGSRARNFEHFELLMLESALAEDDQGCGLSLVCEIGRVPLPLLPPKALGLRRLLT